MEIFIYMIVGFFAQLIDGTLGMAYGVSSNTFLRSIGISSAISSACVHISEIFTTFVSGISHLKLKNVDKKLLFKLLIPGVLGGIIGAYLLVEFENKILDIAIDIYLIIMGIIIVLKSFKTEKKQREFGNYAYGLGLAGGFSDALGGGGWGPVVTSTLLASGHDTRKTIGTVNTAEFFVTIAETTTFIAMLGNFQKYYLIILGLIVGGILAAPIGAILCQKMPTQLMLKIVGILLIILNIYKMLQHINII